MNRTGRIVLSSLLLICLGGCSAPTSSDPSFDITITSSANPATAAPSTGVGYKVTNADDTVSYYDYEYRTSFSVNIKDNAGMAMDITSINLSVQQAAAGIVVTPSGGDQVYYKFNSTAVTNHINKNGAADVGFDVWYALPSHGRESLVTLSLTFSYTDSDDNTYTYSKTADVKVAP